MALNNNLYTSQNAKTKQNNDSNNCLRTIARDASCAGKAGGIHQHSPPIVSMLSMYT